MTSQIEKFIAQLINETLRQDLTDTAKVKIVTEVLPTKVADALGRPLREIEVLFQGTLNKIDGAL